MIESIIDYERDEQRDPAHWANIDPDMDAFEAAREVVLTTPPIDSDPFDFEPRAVSVFPPAGFYPQQDARLYDDDLPF